MEFLIGGYARPGIGGIRWLSLNETEKTLEDRSACDELENPSWLCPHPEGKILYAVEERVPDGNIVVLERAGDQWRVRQRVPAGSAPCHIRLDAGNGMLFVSNYMDGTLSVYRLDPRGNIGGQTDLIRHHGSGPVSDRQEAAHVHSALYDRGVVYVADLGTDQVTAYQVHPADGKLSLRKAYDLPPGSGPRHMATHPEHPGLLYVIGELSGEIYALSLNDGAILDRISVIPEEYSGESRASAIKLVGDTLYAGVRESNNVAVGSIGPGGTLAAPSITLLRHETPRDVWMNGTWCLTADEGSEGVTLLERQGNGLTERFFLPTPGLKPACILEWKG